jgi:hypothetical protein
MGRGIACLARVRIGLSRCERVDMTTEQPADGGQEPAPRTVMAAAAKKPARKNWRPALLRRFPKIFWRPSIDQDWDNDWIVLEEEDQDEYPQLADDLAVWRDLLKCRFRRLDHTAQVLQNQFWRQNVALIIGGLVATSLGAVQAALGGGVVGLAVAQAVLAGALAGLTVLIRSRRAQHGYFTARLKAEQIKTEFFMFLGRVGNYAGPDRRAALVKQVDDIEAAEGAA